jgi:O-acetylhomoserine (thiol)-lyase
MKPLPKNLHWETALLHGANDAAPGAGAAGATIAQSSAFAYDTAAELEAVFAGRDAGYIYTRIGNPTVAQFERRLAALEDGLGAVACASGMAAISAAVLALAGAGDEIVAGSSLFGGTYALFKKTLSRYGLRTTFVEATDVAAYRAALTERTKVIFVETIGNPKLDVPDLAAIAKIANENGVALIVDNTTATPFLVRPKALGAALVVHSTSKFLNGHGNAIGGAIVDCGTFDWSGSRYPHLRPFFERAKQLALLAYLRNQICRDLGGCLAPFNAFLMTLGMETLAVRMERHCANAVQVADFLAAHPRVQEVRFPGHAAHPDHAVARRQFAGRYGALLAFRLADKAACFRFIDRLQLAQNLANIGDARTLVIHPASTICRDLSPDERHSVGVSEDLIRLSVGIEHVSDLLRDLAQALET